MHLRVPNRALISKVRKDIMQDAAYVPAGTQEVVAERLKTDGTLSVFTRSSVLPDDCVLSPAELANLVSDSVGKYRDRERVREYFHGVRTRSSVDLY